MRNKLYLYIGLGLLALGIAGAVSFFLMPRVASWHGGQEVASSSPVAVTVSQLIKFSQLTFQEGGEVEGLLLIVTNQTDATLTLGARRQCQVTYKIFDENDTLLFDSASSTPACASGERVTYLLPAHESRMFEVRHPDSAYHLAAGTYRFELDYPEYGRGERTVTVVKK